MAKRSNVLCEVIRDLDAATFHATVRSGMPQRCMQIGSSLMPQRFVQVYSLAVRINGTLKATSPDLASLVG